MIPWFLKPILSNPRAKTLLVPKFLKWWIFPVAGEVKMYFPDILTFCALADTYYLRASGGNLGIPAN